MRRYIPVLLTTIAVIGIAGLSALTIPTVMRPGPGVKPAGQPVLPAVSEVLQLADMHELNAWVQALEPGTDLARHDAAAQTARIERILRTQRSARTALIRRFGTRVSTIPVFWPLFRPLHDRMPELPAQTQIDIHELEMQYTAANLTAATKAPFSMHLDRVREQAGQAVADEYALRTSPLAGKLRQVSVSLTAAEFRAAFQTLSLLHDAADVASFLDARRLLRAQLGSRKFAAVWSVHDPLFERVSSAAAPFDLSQDVLLSAYAIVLENQEAMLAVAGADARVQQEALREQYAAGRRRLSGLTGAQAAEAILYAAGRLYTRPQR